MATWHSGWTGNFAAITLPGKHAGVCTDWQELAYLSVCRATAALQWDVRLVRINGASPLEHNAVVVFDPDRIDAAHITQAGPDDPAYILDGWPRGKADVYRVSDWIRTQGLTVRPMEVFDPQHEIELRGDRTLAARGVYEP